VFLKAAPPLLLIALLAAGPAAACSLSLGVGGALGLSADGLRYGSGEAGGVARTLTILNLGLGAATITVEAPALAAWPNGFNAGSALVEVAYAGGGLLSGVTQPYTSGASQFEVPALLSVATILTLNNRITSTAGFASGSYQTRTIVTCG
jgi:hypothetical protein